MATKIETSKHRVLVEQWIVEGVSYKTIEERCKNDLNFSVSHMAIKRHADDHQDLKTARESAINNAEQMGLSPDDMVALNHDDVLRIEPPVIANGADAVQYARDTAQRIYCNQLAIVEARQKLYMSGDGRYPHIELMGLKNMLAVLGAMTDGKDKAVNPDEKK